MNTDEPLSPSSSDSSQTYLIILAFTAVLIHLAVNIFGGYGYFRDELYYIACSKHLDWGYVDQPPLSIFLLAISRFIFGESLVGLRFLPALAAGGTVYFGGLMAREMGGKVFAQMLAAVAVLVSPIYLGMMSIYSMNSFDILCWAAVGYLVVRLIKTQSPHYWIWLGVVLGFGLLNKIDVLWLGLGVGVGVLLTPERRWLRTRWPWLGAGVALVLFLPYVIWNITHDFAHLEFIRNASAGKYSGLTPWDFLINQFLPNNPFSIPIWVGGLWFFLGSAAGKRYKPLGWIYVAALVVLIANQHSKAEYLSPAYSLLFAGGGVWIESLIAGRSLNWLKPVVIGILLLSGIVLSPFAMPVLPVETYIQYSEAMGIAPSTAEGKTLERLPQFYADMFGWEKLASTVSLIYGELPPEDKAHCAVYAQNYGEAGAIDFYRKYFDLPCVLSGHNNYYLWGPGTIQADSAVVIVIGGRREDHLRVFDSVEVVGMTNCEYCMPYENHRPIYLCRKLKVPIEEIWPRNKNYS